MTANYQGLNREVITIKCNSNVNAPGQLVKLSDNGIVSKCGDGDTPIGLVLNVRNGYAAVQISGYMEIPHNGTLNAGYQKIGASGDKELKLSAESEKQVLVLDASNSTLRFIF